MQLDTTEIEDKVRGLLADRATMFLSTSANDQPWVAGTFFAESDPFTLALVLEPTGRTLTNIRTNPQVSVVVSSGSPFDAYLQGEGEAVELIEDGQPQATRTALLAKAPEVEPFLQYPLVTLAVRVHRWRVTDVPNGWMPGRELVHPEHAVLSA